LVLDEVLSVGDAQFSQKSVEKMEKVALSGRTVVFVSHSVTAVQKLCKRAILLNEGNIVLEGSVKDVTQRYLGENISERTNADWSNEASPEEAGVVKLLSVSIKDENLNTIGFGNDEGARLNISKGLLVEVTYELLTADRNVYVELTFNNDAHTVLFTAVQPPVKSPLLGINTATVEIPGDFFAEGKIFVSVGFIENAPHSRFIYQENLLHFDVYDPLNGTSIRTHYGAPVPGLIRPSLKWSINDAKRKKS
jgi:lipopolysaccharide transport system ATP-binding protein